MRSWCSSTCALTLISSCRYRSSTCDITTWLENQTNLSLNMRSQIFIPVSDQNNCLSYSTIYIHTHSSICLKFNFFFPILGRLTCQHLSPLFIESKTGVPFDSVNLTCVWQWRQRVRKREQQNFLRFIQFPTVRGRSVRSLSSKIRFTPLRSSWRLECFSSIPLYCVVNRHV